MRSVATARMAATAAVCSLLPAGRSMGTIPNKGVRQQTAVPDRLKDAMAYFGNEQQQNVVMEDTPYVPQEKRQNLLKEAMGMQQNMKSATKLDRLRTALSAVHSRDVHDEGWRDVYLFMRTTELCTELVRVPSDVFPKGSKLWIELEYCEERRAPYFLKMPNGMVVLPLFSFEEYQDYYFSRLGVFDSVWFPVPRMGSRYEAFCQMEFPVSAVGPLQRHCGFATMSIPASQFGVLINPGQRSSKFMTYPEMVYLAKQKKHSLLNEGAEEFDPSLKKVFDTVTMDLVRMSPEDVTKHLATRPKIPQIAQLELHLLLFPFVEVSEVYVRSVARPRWKQVLAGGAETLTQLDIVVHDDEKQRPWRVELVKILQKWSFMAEFDSDVHIEFVNAAPTDPAAMKLYTVADGAFYRKHVAFHGMSLRQALDFDAPLKDADGKLVDTGPKLKY